ncbi:hypothetical protein ACFVUH_20780 [Kitasatospora sp. NPDC058032]|uniref:hypothetical protein n=1 Tax=unclassified Kitasatospora TaxID=2633591 RepID=UPI0033B2412B
MDHYEPPVGGGPGADDAAGYDLCDHCGQVVPREELLGALVPDSSAVHVSEPGLDGRRLVTACSAEHLAALIAVYRNRPFVPEEQWAAKVCRALARCEEPVPLGVVAELSGLSEQQAQRGVDWHNARAREWRARYGGGGDPGANG